MAEGKMWTERELRDFIQMEVSTGQTMQVLNAAISSGERTAVIQAIATAANSQVTLFAAQVRANADEIGRVLGDCRTFVQQTRDESNAAKLVADAGGRRLADKVSRHCQVRGGRAGHRVVQ